MKKPYDITGQRFGRVTVERFAQMRNGNAYWHCRCDCGGSAIIAACHLKSGHTSSCGCLHPEVTSKVQLTHGQSNAGGRRKASRAYRCWQSMLRRCTWPKAINYHRYGGAGITVDRWMSFETFLADMGPPPSECHTIDRIDNDLGYSKANCRWATYHEQRMNQRRMKPKLP